MLIKPTFEHADAFTPRAKIDHDHRPNNETKQGCTGHSIPTTCSLAAENNNCLDATSNVMVNTQKSVIASGVT